MLDDLRYFEGTPEECAHLLAAQRSVRAWLKSDSGWGKATPEIAKPVISDGPGVFAESTVVTPAPASNGPRYHVRPNGKKSHHKGPPSIRKCLHEGCRELCSGNWVRCVAHAREWKHGYNARKIALTDAQNGVKKAESL